MKYDTILGAPAAWLNSSATRWYLVFGDAQARGWWDTVFRTRPGFCHVYALRWDGFNWLLFNPSMALTEVAIMPGTNENALKLLIEPGATVVEVEAFRKTDRIRGRWWVGPMTCVEQIKALIGLPVGHIWTPWQLYRYLTEDHANGHIQKAKDTRADCAGTRTSKAPAIRSRPIDPRRERTIKSRQAWTSRP